MSASGRVALARKMVADLLEDRAVCMTSDAFRIVAKNSFGPHGFDALVRSVHGHPGSLRPGLKALDALGVCSRCPIAYSGWQALRSNFAAVGLALSREETKDGALPDISWYHHGGVYA